MKWGKERRYSITIDLTMNGSETERKAICHRKVVHKNAIERICMLPYMYTCSCTILSSFKGNRECNEQSKLYFSGQGHHRFSFFFLSPSVTSFKVKMEEKENRDKEGWKEKERKMRKLYLSPFLSLFCIYASMDTHRYSSTFKKAQIKSFGKEDEAALPPCVHAAPRGP